MMISSQALIFIAVALVVLVVTSIVVTRLIVKRRSAQLIRERIEGLIPLNTNAPAMSVESIQEIIQTSAAASADSENKLRKLISLAAWHAQPRDVILTSVCVGLGIIVMLAGVLNLSVILSVFIGAVAAAVPFVCLVTQARRAKDKMMLQLPNALDLMVSVLRSGHSIPQALKAVANEIPHPCGREFNEVMQRVNLGQTLPEALEYTIARYESFELDLLRRAFLIHVEVGGSLSELLEKTNKTLRDRIKLQRQVKVLTAPSRLTAIIVALLPFIVAGFTYTLAPHYLQPLITTKIGNALIALSLALQILGVFIMRRLANFKV